MWVLGNHETYGLAVYLQRLLHNVRPGVFLLDPGHAHVVRDLTPGDAVVALTFRPYARRTIELLPQIRQRETALVVVADSAAQPFLTPGDAIFIAPVTSPTVFLSLVPALVLIETIAAAVSRAAPESAHEALEDPAALAQNLNLTIEPPAALPGARPHPDTTCSRRRRRSGTGRGRSFEIEQLELVDPGEGEVLVRLCASGVCHSDYHVVTGGWRRPAPVVLGHEGAGVIEAVGAGVSALEAGDHVHVVVDPLLWTLPPVPHGRLVLCELAERTRGMMGAAPRLWRGDEPVLSGAGVGAFAEYQVVPETGAVAIRRDVPFEIAAIVGCAVTTGIGAVINTADVRPGSSVVIIGCGGVGLSAVLGAALVSAGQVIAIDRVPEKLALALDCGATATIDASKQDVAEEIKALTQGRGVDYAFEAIGNPRTIELAYEALAPGGCAVVVGQVREGAKVSIDPLVLSDREKTLKGSNYGSARPALDFPMIVDLYAEGRLNLDGLVARRLPLAQIEISLSAIPGGAAARSVIVHSAAVR